jgi:hypothetical protein
VTNSSTHTTPVTGAVITRATEDPDEFLSFQVTEQKRKEKVIEEYKMGPEYEKVIEERVRARLQQFQRDKDEELEKLAVRVSREGGWLYKRMPNINHRKKLIALI